MSEDETDAFAEDGESLDEKLERLRAAFIAARPEPLGARKDRIRRLIALLIENDDALCTAMSDDFGNRSREQSMITDILATVELAKYCRDNLDKWARAEKRKVRFPLGLLGARAEVRYEPKGVIGILSPWNFPVNLAFAPLAQVFAAGNRAMLKPSELTPQTSALIAALAARYFAEDELAVVTGGPEVAAAFSSLPFDHLVFTGSTATGRKVMQAAAQNLVPVTLELGGKSPVVIGKGADLAKAADRIVTGKLMNAGQICLAPDYLLVPRDRQDAMIEALCEAVATQYPTLVENPDYASIVSAEKRARLEAMIEDAEANGATVRRVNPAGEGFEYEHRDKLPLTILTGVSDRMQAMQEEIFGPILPIVGYDSIEEAIVHIVANPRPLAIYWFGADDRERETVLARTISGGVTINDVIYHVAMEDLPFGGIGGSGMGCYHGPEGFREFSHAHAVYRQPAFDFAGLAGLKPPYGKRTQKAISSQLKP